jgi:hypothetical protein
MNEEDTMFMRDLSAFFAMNGLLANGDYSVEVIPGMAYKMADDMMEAREDKKVGLPAIKRRSK